MPACIPACLPAVLSRCRWDRNQRGVSYVFGTDVIEEFLTRHDLDLICRAHQVSRPPVRRTVSRSCACLTAGLAVGLTVGQAGYRA